MLEKLRGEIILSERRYGGIKGSSTEHFLLETWDTVLGALEEHDSAANLLSVDFSKAFNRMDHFCCLEALADMGAEEKTIDWVASFLFNRTVEVA